MTRFLSTTALVTLNVVLLTVPQYAYSNPTGGEIVGGSATITESANKLDIHQHTNRAVIDWRSFNIDVNEHTQFHQPSSSAIALNRINSLDPSLIAGQLTANGNIILVNPNGIFFEGTSRVDVNGIVATTASIGTQDFMNGGNDFNITGNPAAAIINNGSITAKEAGLVGLVAPHVINNGIINVKLGRAQLSSADTVTVDFYGDDLLKVKIEDDNIKSQIVSNNGYISANGGKIGMTAAAAVDTINALIVADGFMEANTVSSQGGKIIISAEGSNKTEKTGASYVTVEGIITSSGRNAGEQGGVIEILGDHITLTETALIDASGHSAVNTVRQENTGSATLTENKEVRGEASFLAEQSRAGGSIKIGGDYLGQGTTQTAQTLNVEKGAVIINDAIETGDGGRTIMWSDGTTEYAGITLSRGGEQGGHGGFLETSGKQNLKAQGLAYLSNRAVGYDKGIYLLDPADITIYGNVDENFVSTDSSVDLTNGQVLNADFSDLGTFFERIAAATVDGSFAEGSNITAITRNNNAYFTVNLNIPTSPEGTIYEQGGAGRGTWVGFLSDGSLVLHAGTGSSFINSTSAHLVIPAGSAPTGTGKLSWDINVDTDTIVAYWNDVEIGRDTSAANFTEWSGGDRGGLGEVDNSVVVGANTNDFNGTIIGNMSYYNTTTNAATNVTTIADASGSGNTLTSNHGTVNSNVNAFGTVNGVTVNDNQRYDVANTADINSGDRSAMSRTVTFKTDSEVNTEQVIYKEGGGTNGFIAYVEGGFLNVVFYNDTAANLTSRQIAIDPNQAYTLTSAFDAATNDFTVQLNGEVFGGTAALGTGTVFKSHTGAISFGAANGEMRDENGSKFTPLDTVSTLGQAIFYDRYLNATDRALVDQYQSTKFDINLAPLGTNASENAQATAANGYDVFTTRYLERLSQTADIALQADNSITLDLKGDTLTLTDDRSLSLTTTNGSITDLSAGTIQTNRTTTGGNITLTAGGTGDINLSTTNFNTLNGGLVSLSAGGNVNVEHVNSLNLGAVNAENVNIQTTGTTSDITLNNTVTASGTGNALTLASGRRFINNIGANALDAANGRWVVYSSDPAQNTRNNLLPDASEFNKSFAGNAPSTLGAGNRFIYTRATAPTLTYDINDSNVEYGDVYSGGSITYNTGLIAGDAITAIGHTGDAAYGTTYTPGDDAGFYASILTATAGTLSNVLGYNYAFNVADLTVDKADLTVSVDPSEISRERGSNNPIFNLDYSGFKLAETSNVLDNIPVAKTLATTNSSAGTYSIDLSEGIDNNYNFIYNSGELKVLNQTRIPSTVEQDSSSNINNSIANNKTFSTASNSTLMPQSNIDIQIEDTDQASSENSQSTAINLRIRKDLAKNYDLEIGKDSL